MGLQAATTAGAARRPRTNGKGLATHELHTNVSPGSTWPANGAPTSISGTAAAGSDTPANPYEACTNAQESATIMLQHLDCSFSHQQHSSAALAPLACPGAACPPRIPRAFSSFSSYSSLPDPNSPAVSGGCVDSLQDLTPVLDCPELAACSHEYRQSYPGHQQSCEARPSRSILEENLAVEGPLRIHAGPACAPSSQFPLAGTVHIPATLTAYHDHQPSAVNPSECISGGNFATARPSWIPDIAASPTAPSDINGHAHPMFAHGHRPMDSDIMTSRIPCPVHGHSASTNLSSVLPTAQSSLEGARTSEAAGPSWAPSPNIPNIPAAALNQPPQVVVCPAPCPIHGFAHISRHNSSLPASSRPGNGGNRATLCPPRIVENVGSEISSYGGIAMQQAGVRCSAPHAVHGHDCIFMHESTEPAPIHLSPVGDLATARPSWIPDIAGPGFSSPDRVPGQHAGGDHQRSDQDSHANPGVDSWFEQSQLHQMQLGGLQESATGNAQVVQDALTRLPDSLGVVLSGTPRGGFTSQPASSTALMLPGKHLPASTPPQGQPFSPHFTCLQPAEPDQSLAACRSVDHPEHEAPARPSLAHHACGPACGFSHNVQGSMRGHLHDRFCDLQQNVERAAGQISNPVPVQCAPVEQLTARHDRHGQLVSSIGHCFASQTAGMTNCIPPVEPLQSPECQPVLAHRQPSHQHAKTGSQGSQQFEAVSDGHNRSLHRPLVSSQDSCLLGLLDRLTRPEAENMGCPLPARLSTLQQINKLRGLAARPGYKSLYRQNIQVQEISLKSPDSTGA